MKFDKYTLAHSRRSSIIYIYLFLFSSIFILLITSIFMSIIKFFNYLIEK